MEALYLDRTNKTPLLDLNPDTGVLSLTGRSISDHPIDFYRPIMDWIDRYKNDPQLRTVVNAELEYFNTTSFRVLLGLFKKVAEIQTSGHYVEINWMFEEGDESVMEAGEQYQSLVDATFNLVELED